MSGDVLQYRVISSVDLSETGRRQIAITYDDGPSRWTDDFLEVLEGSKARATFFVIGQAIDAWEDTVSEVARCGHELGNHLFTHPRPDLISEEELEDEIVRTSQRIEAAVGKAPDVIRSPYGLGEDRVAPIAARHGMPTTVHWTVAPYDWKESDSELIVERVLNEIENGGIVSLHDGIPPANYTGHPSRVPTLLATSKLLTLLAQEGYEFVTVSDLVRQGQSLGD
jgi:peptidoglycan/xylan/chitin deacetylase (PgdA/CDA1 family)